MTVLRSLRTRFALSTAGLLLIVLSAFAIFVYQAMARRVLASVDGALELVGAQVASGLEFAGGPVFPEPFAEEPENVDLRQRGYTAWVIGVDGEPLASFGRLQGLAVPPALIGSVSHFATLTSDRGETIRLHHLPTVGEATVVVATSLEETEKTLRDLRTILWVTVPLMVVLAGLGGAFLAARALAPIDRMTQTARRISAEDLSARIGLVATDDELGRLAATFDAMLERLEASFRRERQFSADAAHELRTPLSAIQTILAAVGQRPRSAPEYAQALADLGLEADRLQRVTRDLLRLSQLEAKTGIVHERIDLSTMLLDLADAFRPQAEAKRIRLVCDVPPGLVVSGSSDDLVRLFANLLDNAVKFTEVGQVEISAAATSAGIRVAVSDTGIGIAEEDLGRIFQRFYRADPARSSPGSGLGLAIAGEIAHAHRAHLRATSGLGRGSVFQVDFQRNESGNPAPG